MFSRRQFIVSASATAAAIAVPGLVSAETPEWSPDHITMTGDDEDELRRYQPYLDIPWADQQSLIGVYGWFAESEDYDTRAYYYWAKYNSQNSLFDALPLIGGLFSEDAHFGDHEPVIVLADPDSGEVQRVLYSGYHHFAVDISGEDMTLVEDAESYPTHPSLQVAVPHHHFRHQRDDSRTIAASSISGAEFGSFLDQRSSWEQNGVFDSSSDTAIADPWAMSDRGTWWDESTTDYQFARIRVLLNWRDSDHDELIRE
ncbi:hypothetical protein [Natrialba aegyptia]|uniref:Uncharacterized protein n=1 Tax=Natrialba aegyptia DSM 13077 TaxID=1227491 RepID=M0B637_9EURY|nr:hypothetical protein [Natrialba aegyptia]ELZ05733.1 hypothetical protein C480_10060 [Natrialba aegyptia DSM 13077]